MKFMDTGSYSILTGWDTIKGSRGWLIDYATLYRGLTDWHSWSCQTPPGWCNTYSAQYDKNSYIAKWSGWTNIRPTTAKCGYEYIGYHGWLWGHIYPYYSIYIFWGDGYVHMGYPHYGSSRISSNNVGIFYRSKSFTGKITGPIRTNGRLVQIESGWAGEVRIHP